MDLYSYANGDPVNNLDPDGRFGKGAAAGGVDVVNGLGQLAQNVGGTLDYGLAAVALGTDAANSEYGRYVSGLENQLAAPFSPCR